MDVGWASSLNFVRQLSVRARTTPADAVVRAAACIALPLYAAGG